MINLETLYPVVVGGGVTNLAEPYTPHVSTSITVVDSSQLNPAPNYLSLMTDDKTIVLTVKYQIKEGNTFKQLTIIEGTPGVETHVFGIDTEVLRPICKVDMDDIAENIRLLNVGKQDTIDSTHKVSADYVSDGTNNKVYTSTEKTKLSGIATGAQVNKIETIKANGSVLAITNKAVDIPMATSSTAGLKYNSDSCIQVYVSPTGSDTTGDGSQSKPWREIQTALEKTANLGYEWVRVNCSAGTYEKPIFTGFNYPNCNIYANGDITTPKMEFNQNCGKVILSGISSSTNFNVITTDIWGITLAFGCSLLKQTPILNITAANQGIRIGGEHVGIVSKFNWFIQSFELLGTTNITITNGSGNHGAIAAYYPTARLNIDTLNVDNQNGVGIRLTNESQICTVNKLTCVGTPYSLGYGSVLFIGGKLVGQYTFNSNYYVSPTGNDITGDGTQSNPWRTVQKAIKYINNPMIPSEYYTIRIAEGEYNFTENNLYITRNIEFIITGDVVFNSTTAETWAYLFNVRENAKVIIAGMASTATLTIAYTGGAVTTEEYAFALRQGSLYISNINVIIKTKNGIFSQSGTELPRRVTSPNNLMITETGKLTVERGKVAFQYGIIQSAGEITYGDGTNHEVINLTKCTIASVKSLTGSYGLDGSSVLSINGKWVNQTTEGA